MTEPTSAELLLGLLVVLDKMPGITTTFTAGNLDGTGLQAHHRLKLEFTRRELERAANITSVELIQWDDNGTNLYRYSVDVTEVERP